MIRRLIPHPILTLALILTWMLLVNGTRLGSLILGTILGLIIPLITARYWQGRPAIRNLPGLAAYCGLVIWDILVANVVVARIILFMRPEDIRSAWIAVPVDLTSAEGIAVLAGTITLTPGTVTADMSACGRVLLIHALHAPDPDAVRDGIKSRYEARLKRIFT
jgi:multicomponent K+:H+ antiporter subunit E